MFDQHDIPAYITIELPEIEEEFKAISPSASIFKSIQYLARYAKCKVAKHDFSGVRKCLCLGDKIYFNGTAIVRNAIENVLIFSFSVLLTNCSDGERDRLLSAMPLSLHKIFVNQVLNSGI